MSRIKQYFYIVLTFLSLVSCNKLDLNWNLYKTPEVKTNPIESVSDVSAKGVGNIISDGGTSVFQRGICYAKTNDPTVKDYLIKSGAGEGIFSVNIVSLSSYTTYYLRAYAINKVGTSYGNSVTFTTSGLPSLTTINASSITINSALSGGTITTAGGLTITQRGICFNTSANPTVNDNKVLGGSGIGSYTANLINLLSNTTYYIRAYAINSLGIAYGNQVSFTTANLATLTTSPVSLVTPTSAQSGGNISDAGSSSILERGVCYSTTSNPIISNNKLASGTGTGSYISNLTGLIPNTVYYLRAYATNSAGTAYGNEIAFATGTLLLPTVTTSSPSLITITSATIGGEVANDGGSSVTARGICYNTLGNPTISNSKISVGTGIGSFSTNITGLLSNTKYYMRAYATNSLGTAYGNEVIFTTGIVLVPTLTTTDASSITTTTAASGGEVTSDGGASVTSKGVCYSTFSNPTISNSKVVSGSGTGIYISNISGLTINTTYYLRAYATNTVGTAYGNEISFKTKTIVNPSVTTTDVTLVTFNSASSGGEVTSDGGASVTSRGVCYSSFSNPTISNSKVVSGSGTGIYISNISGLTSNTTYYLRAYATNTAGSAYGNEISFKTKTIVNPSVTTTDVTLVTVNSASSGGEVTSDGGASVTSRGVCYNTSSNPTILNSKVISGSGIGVFTSNITGLLSNTTYFLRSYATNSAGTAYGNEVSFSTNAILAPTLSTTVPSLITNNTCNSGGNVTSDGGSTVISRGVCYNTLTNPSILDNKIASGTGIGAFSVNITGLTSNTTYYIRSYATNAIGTAYGNQVSFTTTTVFTIGLNYGGGVIFYIDGTGQHGLISASTDQPYSDWGCSGTLLSGCAGTAIGTGQSNTTAIVTICTTLGIAARVCNDLVLNGYSDWYLPSKDELNLMYLQKSTIGGFATGYYWSSTQIDNLSAWKQSFLTGSQSSNGKYDLISVRSIRAF